MGEVEAGQGKTTNYKPTSGEYEFEQFIKTTVYDDYLGEIDCRIEDLRSLLEVADGKKYLTVQGAIKSLRESREIFIDLIENRKNDLREEALEREEEQDA